MAKCISILRNEHLALPGADELCWEERYGNFPIVIRASKAFYPKKNSLASRCRRKSRVLLQFAKESGIDTRRVVRGWVNLFNKQKGAKKWRTMLGEG